MYVDVPVLPDLPPSIFSGYPFHIAEIHGSCFGWICTVFRSCCECGKPTGKYKRKDQQQRKRRSPYSFVHVPFSFLELWHKIFNFLAFGLII